MESRGCGDPLAQQPLLFQLFKNNLREHLQWVKFHALGCREAGGHMLPTSGSSQGKETDKMGVISALKPSRISES